MQTGDEELAAPPTIAKSKRKVIASVAAIVVVVAGAAITYTALNDAGGSGAGSPKEAVQTAITDLHNGDIIGLLDDMPSGERAAISGPLQDDVSSLQRLGVLSQKADPHKVTGVTFTATNLAFADPIVVNDHLQIVKITGGTVTANADALKLPLTAHMLDITHASSAQPKTQTVNLASVAGGVRIATVKQSGRWYVSIFYTAADSAANHQLPTAADALPAHGATSATGAVTDAVNDLLSGKLTNALELVSPDELGAVHDYGGLILSAVQGFPDSGIKVTTLDLKQTTLSDGAVRVSPTKIALSLPDGKSVSVVADGPCETVTIDGTSKKECASDAVGTLENELGQLRCFGAESDSGSGFGSGGITVTPSDGDSSDGGFSVPGGTTPGGALPGDLPSDGSDGFDPCTPTPLTAAQKAALTHLITGYTGLGIVVSQSGGLWYIDPIRTLTELSAETIGSLQGNDIFALVSIFTG